MPQIIEKQEQKNKTRVSSRQNLSPGSWRGAGRRMGNDVGSRRGKGGQDGGKEEREKCTWIMP